MGFECDYVFGFLPIPQSTGLPEQGQNFDALTVRWMGVLVAPVVVAYGYYSLVTDCHKGWYSFVLTGVARIMYSGGFLLVLPQVVINHQHQTVAHLPWRSLVYKAISTLIQDLFMMIIKMPTRQRLSCFRDYIALIVYFVQWLQYSL